jgi:hypothetical protein
MIPDGTCLEAAAVQNFSLVLRLEFWRGKLFNLLATTSSSRRKSFFMSIGIGSADS